MKIRNGFVSNSSSSSFIIASKTKKKLHKKLEEVFKTPSNYPIQDLGDEVVSTIMGCLRGDGYGEDTDSGDSFSTIEEYQEFCEEQYIDTPDPEIVELIKQGFTVYVGEFCSDEGGIENILCETQLRYKDDELVIIHDGGY